MKKKTNNKILSINKIAHIYNGRSRSCAKCYLHINQRYCIDNIYICDICSKSFVEGFTKGVKYERKKNRKPITLINTMDFRFAGINSRGNKCYNNDNIFIEEVNGDFWYLNQCPAYGFNGIEGEPWYKIKKDVINIIE